MPDRPPPLTTIPPEIVAVTDYEPLARARVEPSAWAYLTCGGADEITLRSNRDAFDRLLLNPRVLTDFSRGGSTAVTLFGQTFDYPILLAPVAYQKLAHPEGELATVLGAAAAKAGMIVSTHASVSLEDIARAAQTPLWFQLYIKPDRGLTRELVQRAEAAGYQALVLTVDAPVGGVRNREQRSQFRLPPGVLGGQPARGGPDGRPRDRAAAPLAGGPPRDRSNVEGCRVAAVAHEDAGPHQRHHQRRGRRARGRTGRGGHRGLKPRRPHPGHAAGHDRGPARIADRVGGRLPILVDGGIRHRGTDVLKALALGASAVLVGRPIIHGLATAGALGVAHVMNILRGELEGAMALTGRATLAEIDHLPGDLARVG